MPISTTHIATARSSRYIKQLVSHLGRKAVGTLSADGRGTITFEWGACTLAPMPGYLELIAKASDFEALTRVQDVVTRHLLGFATHEELTATWTAPSTGESVATDHPVIRDYLLTHCTQPDGVLEDLVAETREVTGNASGMQISHDEGALLTMLVRMTGARHAIEVGVFTGYSSLCIARGLPEGGRLLACDVNEEWTSIARRYWERAGVADRIDLKIGPAVDTLRMLPGEPAFGIAFIDADKVNYPVYYEEIVQRLHPGGLVVVDNVLLGGRVLDPAYREEHHLAVRRMNDRIAEDDRVDSVMLPVRDGITLARKR